MARWRLTAPHYLNVPGSEWEYKEVDRTTGKQKRVTFPVPQHLDPDNPSDWTLRNGRDEGAIIVCHPNKGEPNDIPFTDGKGKPGDPTPDMVPLDAEAEALTKAMSPKWNRPFEQTEGNSYAEGILDDLTKEIVALRSTTAQAAPLPGMDELLKSMGAMMAQNQQLIQALVANQQPKVEAEPVKRRA